MSIVEDSLFIATQNFNASLSDLIGAINDTTILLALKNRGS